MPRTRAKAFPKDVLDFGDFEFLQNFQEGVEVYSLKKNAFLSGVKLRHDFLGIIQTMIGLVYRSCTCGFNLYKDSTPSGGSVRDTFNFGGLHFSEMFRSSR